MPRVAVVGASLDLVTSLVTRALDLTHVVSVFVGRGVRFKMSNERVTLYQGAFESEGLEACLERSRYVFCAHEPSAEVPIERALTALIGRVDPKLKRLVFFSRVGAAPGAAARGVRGLLGQVTGRTRELEEFARAEGVLRGTKLPYVLLRLPKLSGGNPRAEVLGVPLAQESSLGGLSCAEVASFAFDILDDPMLHRAELALGSAAR